MLGERAWKEPRRGAGRNRPRLHPDAERNGRGRARGLRRARRQGRDGARRRLRRRRQQRRGAPGATRARARALGVRLLGPNSMGLIDVPGRVALSANAVLEMEALPAGTTSFVSQSVEPCSARRRRAARRGACAFSKLVSVGNEADLGVAELVELLAVDPSTRVILLFLETVRDAVRLSAAARKAHAAGKPVVAYKLGRSRLGEDLARSHTGALAGEDAAVSAFFRDCGIARVEMLETLLEIAPAAHRRGCRKLSRPVRVAVMTTTQDEGGEHHRSPMGAQGLEAIARTAAVASLANPELRDPGFAHRRGHHGCDRQAIRQACLMPCSNRPPATRSSRVVTSAQFIHNSRSSRSCDRSEAPNLWRRFSLRTPALARVARRARHRRVPHAGILRRRARRFFRLALAARAQSIAAIRVAIEAPAPGETQ